MSDRRCSLTRSCAAFVLLFSAAGAARGQTNLKSANTDGATFDTISFFDAAATPEGVRTEFGPVGKDVAFELWIEGRLPRKVFVNEPDPDHAGQTRQVQKPFVSVLRVSAKEFDEYVKSIRDVAPPGDEGMFMTAVLGDMIEQKTVLVQWRDSLPEIERRAQVAIDKLKLGTPFKEVVKVYSEDETSRQADGLFGDDPRGFYMSLYPLVKVLYDMKKGDVVGPIYSKNAAYIVRCEEFTPNALNAWKDRVRATAIVLRYPIGPDLKQKERAKIRAAVRVRSDLDRFKRILPPASQVPRVTQFGPVDVAPLGTPAAPLNQRSADDSRDNLPPAPPPQPAPPAPKSDKGGGKQEGEKKDGGSPS